MSVGVIAELRALSPRRPLTPAEAYSVAEQQAAHFHALLGNTEPPLREHAIANLPRVHVRRVRRLPVSGASEWSHGRWLVLLNGAEPIVRQRFSLAHEFKHIIDHRLIDLLYSSIPASDRHVFIERICDYFAGCVLVPEAWIKQAHASGIERPGDLASHFQVSRTAVHIRLRQTRLSTPKHSTPDWPLPDPRDGGTRGGYRRCAEPLLI